MKPTRLLIVDDHVLVRKGISMFLEIEESIEIVGEADNGREALRLAKVLCPDVILLDLVMPQGDGMEAISHFRQEMPDLKIIVLTTFEDEHRVKAAFKAGAHGYLLKDADGATLLQAIQAVQKGGMPLHPTITQHLLKANGQNGHSGYDCLSKREKEVLRLVARGVSNKEIALALQLSKGTVKIHVSNILAKLHMASRTEAAAWMIQAGLLTDETNSSQLS